MQPKAGTLLEITLPHAQGGRNRLSFEGHDAVAHDTAVAKSWRTIMNRVVGCTLALVRCLLALTALALMSTTCALAAEQVDLLLALSSDVSRSIDHPKFLLQREGYAAAISDPQVMDAIKSGPQQRIALCFIEWSGFGAQKLVIDWTIIDGPSPARQIRRPTPGIAPIVRRPHFDQRRDRVRGRSIGARAVRRRAPHHRRLGRWHQQCGPRREARPRRDRRQRNRDQWSRHSERAARAVERRAYQPTRRNSRNITKTMSSADPARSSWWRRTSTRSAEPLSRS